MIRYSGDAEIRFAWDPKGRRYVGTVVDPFRRWRGAVRGPKQLKGRSLPDSHDAAAMALLRKALRTGPFQVQITQGRLQMQRGFQAPCPAGMRGSRDCDCPG